MAALCRQPEALEPRQGASAQGGSERRGAGVAHVHAVKFEQGHGRGSAPARSPTASRCTPSVERTTASGSAGEVVVAHPSPAPGTVDGMSGDLGEKGRVWLGQELGRVP